MTSLIAVENSRESGLERPIHTVQDTWHLEGLAQLPGDDIPGMPVDDRHESHPSVDQSDVRKIDPPDVVGVLGCDVPEEIRIDPVLQRSFAEIRTWMDSFDAHFPHGSLNPIPAHDESFPGKNRRNAATSEERPAGADLVDPVPKQDLLGRGKDRLIVEPGTGDTQQHGLRGERELWIVKVDKTLSIAMAQAIPDFFFNHASWVVSWPIS